MICSRRPHNGKTGHFTSQKERERLQNVKRWKCTCKACRNTVFHCQICKFVRFLLPSSSWLLKLPINCTKPTISAFALKKGWCLKCPLFLMVLIGSRSTCLITKLLWSKISNNFLAHFVNLFHLLELIYLLDIVYLLSGQLLGKTLLKFRERNVPANTNLRGKLNQVTGYSKSGNYHFTSHKRKKVAKEWIW